MTVSQRIGAMFQKFPTVLEVRCFVSDIITGKKLQPYKIDIRYGTIQATVENANR